MKTANRIFVTGGSGFVGREVIRRLLGEGFAVRALVRTPALFDSQPHERLEIARGDALSPETLLGKMSECDAVINIIGIIREKRLKGITYERLHVETVKNLLDEAVRAGVERFVQMSALGVRPDGVSRYQTTKFTAELEIQRRMPKWTIFRPSIIIGPGRGFVSEIRFLLRLPLAPIFGDGNYTFEPVDKRIVAEAFVAAINQESTYCRILELRGPKAYSFNEILDRLGHALGRRKVRKLHLPLWLARPLVSILGRLPFSPVNRDQLEMLLESKAAKRLNGVAELGLPEIDLPEQLEYAFQDYGCV